MYDVSKDSNLGNEKEYLENKRTMYEDIDSRR